MAQNWNNCQYNITIWTWNLPNSIVTINHPTTPHYYFVVSEQFLEQMKMKINFLYLRKVTLYEIMRNKKIYHISSITSGILTQQIQHYLNIIYIFILV